MKKQIISYFLWCIALFAQAEKHYTVIVSLDGFRWDYPQMYETPFFDQMAREGVKATMIPSFPSKTFPNHYTMATGLVPDHHGIVANSFWDPERKEVYKMNKPATRNDASYYGGEPIWVTAQKQGIKTGNVYWVGSDIAVKGEQPTYYQVYDKKPRLSQTERVAEVLRMLRLPEADRPQLVMLYFEDSDTYGHTYSPFSQETRKCIARLDALMRFLWEGLQSLPFAKDVNLIVTSDHGMATVSADRFVPIKHLLKEEWYTLIDGNLPAQIYTQPQFRDSVYHALKDLNHVRVWKKEDIPAYLNYGSNPRVGDIIVLPDLGWLVEEGNKTLPGAHGFDPTYDDMQVMFRACGPDFKKGYEAPKFRNVSIYSLLARLLQITPEKTDGCLEEVENMLIQ
ncbi:ectonucleotide pyrophosphatase/phosphodiesterase [Phocaeicola plebeius]|uniref:alkaline phosphatase family protein n=1 Tax=Phocaeicola plebeius TaxID=310297 RepID=UPI003AEF414C